MNTTLDMFGTDRASRPSGAGVAWWAPDPRAHALGYSQKPLRGSRLPRPPKTNAAPLDGERLIDAGRPVRSKVGRIALAFPDVYALGMSNLGFHTVYGLVNEQTAFACERAFYPDAAAEPAMKAGKLRPRTVETSTELRHFDAVSFSIPFETNYIYAAKLLHNSGIPLRAADRTSLPLVFAGGYAVSMNPEPIAEFLDFAVVGEAEGVLEEVLDAMERHLDALRNPGTFASARAEFIEEIAGVRGVYVPELRARDGAYRVARNYVADLSESRAFSRIVARRTHFSDTFLIEATRGCVSSCAFCMAGLTTKPYRTVPLARLLENSRAAVGVARQVGIVGASPADHPRIRDYAEAMLDAGLKASFSSLRLSAIDDRLLDILVRSGQKTLTIAPEVLDETYRRRIDKGFPTNARMREKMAHFFDAGIPTLKLYFMLGFPFEDDEYYARLADFLSSLSAEFLEGRKGRRRRLEFSLAYFIPKPHTPLAGAPMMPAAKMRAVRRFLRANAKGRASLSFEGAEASIVQGYFSRAGREAADVIEWWLDKAIDRQTMKAAVAELGLEEKAIAPRAKAGQPWDFIDTRPTAT